MPSFRRFRRFLAAAALLIGCDPMPTMPSADGYTIAPTMPPSPSSEVRRRVTGMSGSDMTIYPIGPVALWDVSSASWNVYHHDAPSHIRPADLAGGLLPATRYWVYATAPLHQLTFAVSTVEPDVGLRYMTNDAAYMYVSTFFVDASGRLEPYAQVGGDYTLSAVRVVSRGNATILTPIPRQSVPARATRLSYLVAINATETGREVLIGDASGLELSRLVDNGSVPWAMRGEVGLTPVPIFGYLGTFAYQVSDASTEVTIDITGFVM